MMSQIAELAATTSSRPAFVIGIRAKYRKRLSASLDHRHRAATSNDAGEAGSGDAVDHLVDVLVGCRAFIERHVPRVHQDVALGQPAVGVRLFETAIGGAPREYAAGAVVDRVQTGPRAALGVQVAPSDVRVGWHEDEFAVGRLLPAL